MKIQLESKFDFDAPPPRFSLGKSFKEKSLSLVQGLCSEIFLVNEQDNTYQIEYRVWEEKAKNKRKSPFRFVEYLLKKEDEWYSLTQHNSMSYSIKSDNDDIGEIPLEIIDTAGQKELFSFFFPSIWPTSNNTPMNLVAYFQLSSKPFAEWKNGLTDVIFIFFDQTGLWNPKILSEDLTLAKKAMRNQSIL